MSDQWIRPEAWRDSRRTTLRLGAASMLHHGLMSFQEVVQSLGNKSSDEHKAAACADLLLSVAVAKGWLPEGSQPVALWVEPEYWDLCLMVTHSSLAPVRDCDRPPVVRPERP